MNLAEPADPNVARKRREAILATVAEATCQSRPHTYGDAEDEFPTVAGLWSCYLSRSLDTPIPLESADVAVLLALLKIARIAANPDHADSWVDLAGYAVCGGGIVTAKAADAEKAED